MSWLERLVGLSFILSGLAKFFSFGQDAVGTLDAMAEASTGTELGPVSQFLVHFNTPVIYCVRLVLPGTGLARVLRHPAATGAAAVQLAMLPRSPGGVRA